MPKKYKKPEGEPERPHNTTDPRYKTDPKEKKQRWRGHREEMDNYILQELARGRTYEQLGIRNKKEEGQAGFRKFGMRDRQGFQDPNWTYDFESGMKRHHGTSDEAAQGRWVPIEPHEMAEYQAQQNSGGSWLDRLHGQTNAQLRNWAAQNAIKGGALRQDEHGFYMSGDAGERIDFDQFGNLIDANTGAELNDMFYGDGSNITGFITQQGYKSPWALPGGTPGGVTGSRPQGGDRPSATEGRPIQPGVLGPPAQPGGGGLGTARPSTDPMTSMGNAWNRQAMAPRPSTPTRPTAPMGSRPNRPVGVAPGMGTMAPSAQVNNRQGGMPQQPKRISFAY